jgi:hypothetical protein
MTSLVPNSLDHDLALHLCETAELSDHERVICTLIALASSCNEAVQAETMATFRRILGRTAT